MAAEFDGCAEQLVESVGGVHLIVIAPGRCVCYVVSSQLADAAQHGVGARDPCAGPLAQGVHQEGVEVFDAGAAAEADAEHGTEDLAVLKSPELRPFAQLMVDPASPDVCQTCQGHKKCRRKE